MRVLNSLEEIKNWKEQQISTVSTNHYQLNKLHDDIISKTVHLAMENVQKELGEPPAPFAFFLMGSAGRFEQSVWSDQDNGIIFDGEEHHQSYFLSLGKEISQALEIVGYAYCDGKVMASYPLWCQSIENWKVQIKNWLEEASWQSLRHFSTFFDSRVLLGQFTYLRTLKEYSFDFLQENPKLYQRLIENFDFIKKGIGVFGQLLPELHGKNEGSIPLKQTTFFPYVNAMRILALKNNITSPSTINRFKELPTSYGSIKNYEEEFSKLLDLRLQYRKNAESYEEVHHLPLDLLTKEDKKELKQLMKNGYKLFSETKTIIEKECSPWL